MTKTKQIAQILIFTLFCSAVFSTLSGNSVLLKADEAASGHDKAVREVSLSNPTKDEEGNILWDTVYFGNYWQSDTNHSVWADKKDEKQPVLWRVLSVTEDGKATLLSEKSLENRRYNETSRDVNWGNCTLRSWLNGYGREENEDQIDYKEDNFLNEAFSEKEQELLAAVSLHTQENPSYGTDCGEDMQDKVYLLAVEDIKNEAYGFINGKSNNYANDIAQTAYCRDTAASSSDSLGSGCWWLRTSGKTNKSALNFLSIYSLDYESDVAWSKKVRPVVCVDLKKADADCLQYAGKISNGLVKTTNPTDKTKLPVMPVREGGSTTWDCITFGSYLQNDTNMDGKIDESDEREPIKWRVINISKDGKTLTLLSDKNLDRMYFNETCTDMSWGISAIRSWLNGYDGQQNADAKDYSGQGFYNTAFSEEEQGAIAQTALADAGTIDKVYLLSVNEVTAKKYGFEVDENKDSYSRVAENTTYADMKFGGTKGRVLGDWYLRDVSNSSKWTSTVFDSGSVSRSGSLTGKNCCAVRPVIRLSLEQAVSKDGSPIWEYAGTVTTRSDEYEPLFVTLSTDNQIKKGDIDGDGKITLKDAQIALKGALHLLTIREEQKQAADLSETGEITLKEARKILRAALHIDAI